MVRSAAMSIESPRGADFSICRQQRLDRIGDRDDVGAGLAFDVEDQRRLAVVPGRQLFVFKSVDGLADIAELDRCAVSDRRSIASR